MVGMTGFEPAAFSSQMRRDTKLRYAPSYFATNLLDCSERNGAPDMNRTCNPQIRSLVLYPVELQARKFQALNYLII